MLEYSETLFFSPLVVDIKACNNVANINNVIHLGRKITTDGKNTTYERIITQTDVFTKMETLITLKNVKFLQLLEQFDWV